MVILKFYLEARDELQNILNSSLDHNAKSLIFGEYIYNSVSKIEPPELMTLVKKRFASYGDHKVAFIDNSDVTEVIFGGQEDTDLEISFY